MVSTSGRPRPSRHTANASSTDSVAVTGSRAVTTRRRRMSAGIAVWLASSNTSNAATVHACGSTRNSDHARGVTRRSTSCPCSSTRPVRARVNRLIGPHRATYASYRVANCPRSAATSPSSAVLALSASNNAVTVSRNPINARTSAR